MGKYLNAYLNTIIWSKESLIVYILFSMQKYENKMKKDIDAD